MGRSVWKGRGPKYILKNGDQLWSRNQYIISDDVGKFIRVYNGKIFVEIMVEESMVGRPFGDYVNTRRMGVGIHLKKRKKKN